MANQTPKQRLFTEREKVRHTTHWDLDYLPIEEVEGYYFQHPAKKQAHGVAPPKKLSSQRKLGLVLIGIGAGLFAVAVVLGRLWGG